MVSSSHPAVVHRARGEDRTRETAATVGVVDTSSRVGFWAGRRRDHTSIGIADDLLSTFRGVSEGDHIIDAGSPHFVIANRMTQDIQARDASATRASRADWRWDALRKLRLEEAMFLFLFIPSMVVTIWANVDLYTEGVRSRRIRGGILRLAIVAAIAVMLPVLDRWRHRLSYGVGRSTVEFFRTFFPFALCSAVYTNLHDTVRWINPHDIHDTLMVIEEWMFGFQPVVWAEQFITPERTEFFSLIYTNFFVLTIVVSCVLWAAGKRQQARETMLGIIVCFYSGYILYVIFPAAPPRLYYESLGMFAVDLGGGPITDFQNALINMMPNQASRAAFPSLHAAVSLVVLCYAWRFCRWLFPILVLFVVGLLTSTVYLRHHYVIDLIAGVPLVPWALWLAPRLDRWWKGSGEPYDLGERKAATSP